MKLKLYKLNFNSNIFIIFMIILFIIFLFYNYYKFDNIDKFNNIDNIDNNKIDISLGILSYNAPDTLKQTLQTYKESGLLDISNDVFAILQKSNKQDEESIVCENYNIRFIKMPDNGKMASGFKAIYENAKNEIVVFLENDFVNYSTKQESIDFFKNSINFIKHQNIDLIRARNRKNAGEPNIGIELFSKIPTNEFKNHTCLSECIYWIDNPEIIYPEKIKKIKPLIGNDDWYTSSSKSCNWTNNALVTSKTFFKEAVLPYIFGSDDIESSFGSIWAQQNYNCVFGPGLFTHYRLDGH
jgi:hypothetical protein